MTRDNAKDYLLLVQALADGKTLQELYSGSWVDLPYVEFSFEPAHYRIKPEPREFWINTYPRYSCVHATKEDANNATASGLTETIHVREVI